MKDDKTGNVIGIHSSAEIIKNKLARPFRKCELDILFDKGISEFGYMFDEFRERCESAGPILLEDGRSIMLEGTGAWKNLLVKKGGQSILDIKFNKREFEELFNKDESKNHLLDALENMMVVVSPNKV